LSINNSAFIVLSGLSRLTENTHFSFFLKIGCEEFYVNGRC
jgi:hypothetical protein